MALYLHWLRRDLRHHLPLFLLWFLAAAACTWARLEICHMRGRNSAELFFWFNVKVMDFLSWFLAAEVIGAVLRLKSDPPDGTDVWWKHAGITPRPPP